MQANAGFLNHVQAAKKPGLLAAKKPGGRPGRLATLIRNLTMRWIYWKSTCSL
jgi:hypothetical protein